MKKILISISVAFLSLSGHAKICSAQDQKALNSLVESAKKTEETERNHSVKMLNEFQGDTKISDDLIKEMPAVKKEPVSMR